MEKLSNQEIERYLGTYLDEYKLVKDVKYANGEIEAELIPFIYPFVKEDSGYVNNTQINLYISQLAYILMAKCAADKNFPMVTSLIGYDEYEKRMHQRNIFFGNMVIKMKKVIYKKNLPIRASMKMASVRKLSGRVFCEIEFDMGKGSCFGTLLGSI